jgi:hypothetical protein
MMCQPPPPPPPNLFPSAALPTCNEPHTESRVLRYQPTLRDSL